jgi:hypothetical protein
MSIGVNISVRIYNNIIQNKRIEYFSVKVKRQIHFFNVYQNCICIYTSMY